MVPVIPWSHREQYIVASFRTVISRSRVEADFVVADRALLRLIQKILVTL
jgi:hypothetical protein